MLYNELNQQELHTLRKLANEGNTDAQCQLGLYLCIENDGSPKTLTLKKSSCKEGIKWLNKARRNGNKDALNFLKDIYGVLGENGNMILCYHELDKKYNDAFAQYFLGSIEDKNGHLSTAYYFYKKSAENGYEPAIQRMKCYEESKNRNPDNAVEIDQYPDKSYVIYALLGLFFGEIGLHNFYAGQTKKGLIKLALCLTIIGILPSALWGFYEAAMAYIHSSIVD